MAANDAVSTFDLAQDPRIVAIGVPFMGSAKPRSNFYKSIGSKNNGIPAEAGTYSVSVQNPTDFRARGASGGGSASWTIPIQVTVTVGGAAPMQYPTVTELPNRTLKSVERSSEALRPARPALESTSQFSANSLMHADFSWDTALSLVLASSLSYAQPAEVTSTARDGWGLETCEFIEMDDTQCFVCSSSDAVLVAFRGSESLGEWLGNLNLPSTTRHYGKVHRGFLGAFQAIDAKLRTALTPFAGRPVLVTGHSLGGALAVVAAAEWRDHVDVARVYTYGQPAVGNKDFCTYLEQYYAGRYYRFVNDDDIVPRVPPNYRHAGRLFHFDASGDLESLAMLTEATGELAMLTESEFDHLRSQLLQQQAQEKLAVERGQIEAVPLASPEELFPSFSGTCLPPRPGQV